MKGLIAALSALVFVPAVVAAQDSAPSLRGTWQGAGKILLYGNTEHLSGSAGMAVVRDLNVTHTVLGARRGI